jgi:hypothetical protein
MSYEFHDGVLMALTAQIREDWAQEYFSVSKVLAISSCILAVFFMTGATPVESDEASGSAEEAELELPEINWEESARVEVQRKIVSNRTDGGGLSEKRCEYIMVIEPVEDAIAIRQENLLPVSLPKTTNHILFDRLYEKLECAFSDVVVSGEGEILESNTDELSTQIQLVVRHYYGAHTGRFPAQLGEQVAGRFEPIHLEGHALWWWELVTGELLDSARDAFEVEEVPCVGEEDGDETCLGVSVVSVEDRRDAVQVVAASYETVEQAQVMTRYDLVFDVDVPLPRRVVRKVSTNIEVLNELTEQRRTIDDTAVDTFSLQVVEDEEAHEPERLKSAMDREIIQEVVRENRDGLRACFNEALARDPELSGRLVIQWVIGSTGEVESAEVFESELENDAFHKCVTDLILVWEFPPPDGGGIVRVNYPFNFSR